MERGREGERERGRTIKTSGNDFCNSCREGRAAKGEGRTAAAADDDLCLQSREPSNESGGAQLSSHGWEREKTERANERMKWDNRDSESQARD